MKTYYVYILECSDGTFYIGISSNMERRLYEHKSGLDKEAYSYSRRPIVLKWLQGFSDPKQAIAFEKQLKGWSRRKKLALMAEDWDKLVKYSKNYTQFGKFDSSEGSSTSSD
jgi:putative endonuclease